MTIKEQRLIYLCRNRSRSYRYLCLRLQLDLATLEALVERCRLYVTTAVDETDFYKNRCRATLEGKLVASDYGERLFRLYYPLVISSISLIISTVSLLLR